MEPVVLLLTFAEAAPELLYTSDALLLLKELDAAGVRAVWIRASPDSDLLRPGLAVMKNQYQLAEVYLVDTTSSESVQHIIAAVRTLSIRQRLLCVFTFGLGTCSRLGIVLGRTLGIPALIIFNDYQVQMAACLDPYTLDWCLNNADVRIASNVPAHKEAGRRLGVGKTMLLADTAVLSSPAMQISTLYILDTRFYVDRFVASRLVSTASACMILDKGSCVPNCENVIRYAANCLYIVGTIEELRSLDTVITCQRFCLISRQRGGKTAPRWKDSADLYADRDSQRAQYLKVERAVDISYREALEWVGVCCS